ncbi:AEC family transporter [Oceanispirochaeta sp.]|jgi:predicted permease|uniref:AEC family transporter n=1 Tax=Oceanispirochaeta sp. TaxID=2035350 RepID=UPI002626078D|nr:AEC family transporter [Oceanispirochaeta sp.]MDA3958308.1 AEC family transporter [Oceanispirochaeta sp.]
MNVLIHTLQGVVPVFLLIVIGSILKHRKVIGPAFQKSSSIICFKLGLPALIFLKIAGLDFSGVFNINEILILLAIALITMITTLLLSLRLKDVTQRGAFSQGAFRGNIAIIGLALVLNLYGEDLAARGAMIVAVMLPVFNILSVIALTIPRHGMSLEGLIRSLKNIITNPIIMAVLAALGFSLFKIPVPVLLGRLLKYLADLALPLALINIGGSLSARGFREKGKIALAAALIKVVLLPVIAVIIFYKKGYNQEELGLIFLIAGAPTALSSHIMADAMDNDGDLAALIIMVSTTLAAVTTLIGISIINSL